MGKKLTVSRKRAKNLTVTRKSHYPIETLKYVYRCISIGVSSGGSGGVGTTTSRAGINLVPKLRPVGNSKSLRTYLETRHNVLFCPTISYVAERFNLCYVCLQNYTNIRRQRRARHRKHLFLNLCTTKN